MSESNPRLMSIFNDALECSDPAARAEYLDQACGGDADLRKRVEELLSAHAEAGSFLQPDATGAFEAAVAMATGAYQPDEPTATTAPAAPSAPADSPHAKDPLSTTDPVPDSTGGDGAHPDTDIPAGEMPGVPGYQVMREIARGGMGCVLAARDLSLDRDVALKILLPGANADRFVRESKITARLPHPGIPPVHALGTLADGSPFLAMKLIAGQTLADEMKSADRPRLLQVFTQICQAVGFAHSRGIIHRDLKPANVMVGAFGEVQVMDWGLAKDLTGQGREGDGQPSAVPNVPAGDADPDATTAPSAAGQSTDEQTQAGQIMGTPAYMAPEQARGEATDARSDVFALGGILCTILTGKPPFSGKSAIEVIRRAGAADLAEAHARLDRCGADAELVALCRRCLSPQPSDRPADGQAVADEMTAYLDGVQDRLRQAELAEAEAKAKAAEERKRRRLTLALAAVVLLAVFAGGGGWLYVRSERKAREAAEAQRQVKVTQEVSEAFNKAMTLRVQATSAKKGSAALYAQAREQAQRARALVENGLVDEALAVRVRDLQADLDDEEKDRKFVAAIDEARLDQATHPPKQRQTTIGAPVATPLEGAIPKFRKAFQEYGLAPGKVKPTAAAARIRKRPQAVRKAILAALDEWYDMATDPKIALNEPHRDWLNAMLREVEPSDGWSRRFREARQEKDMDKRRAALEKLAEEPGVPELPADVQWQLARRLSQSGVVPKAVELLRSILQKHPDDFWVNFTLAELMLLKKPPLLEECLRFRTVAAALRPDSPGAQNNLGYALLSLGKVDDAIAAFKRAIELAPKWAGPYVNLGIAFQDKWNLEESAAYYRKAIEIDPQEVVALLNLGMLLYRVGKIDEGMAFLKRAIEVDPKASYAYSTIGTLLAMRGKTGQAIPYWKKAVELDPNDTQANYGLGLECFRQEKTDEAIAHFKKVIEVDPSYSNTLTNLGTALLKKGAMDEGIAYLQKALKRNPGDRLANQHLAHAKEVVATRDKVKAYQSGNSTPSNNTERLKMADWCVMEKLYRTGFKLYLEAFADEPKLSDDLKGGYRYNAACAAVMIASGKAEDNRKLENKERLALRQQALDWLRANLTARSKQVENPSSRSEASRALLHWQQDSDLASIRDKAALEKLPPDEQKAFAQLWEDVARLWIKAQTSAYPKDTFATTKRAALLVWFGLDKDYEATVEAAVRFAKDTNDPTTAERTAKVCCLRPSTDQAQLDAALALARSAVKNGEKTPYIGYFRMALGMAEYRSGNYAAAESALIDAVKGNERNRHIAQTSTLYRGMSLYRQGKKTEGAVAALGVVAAMKPLPKDEKNPLADRADADDLILWLAYKEANALFGFSDALSEKSLQILAAASAANPKDTMLMVRVAAVQVWFGHDKDYEATVQRALRFAKDAKDRFTAERTAKACSLVPSTDQARLDTVLALARIAVKKGEKDPYVGYFRLALGMAEFRCGNFTAAEQALLAAVKGNEDNRHIADTSAFFRAMCLYRQGKKAEARDLATAAVAKMKPMPKDRQTPLDNGGDFGEVIVWLAYHEAKALIGFEATPPSREAANLQRLEETLERLKAKLGPDHADTLAAMDRLAQAYLAVAARQAWFGQEMELAATAEKVLQFAGDTKNFLLADKVAKVCCLRPLDDKNREAVLRLARCAVELGKKNEWVRYFQMTLGMAEYRAGHFAEAEAALTIAMQAGKDDPRVAGTAAFYRAMSLFRQGKKDQASTLARETVARMKPLPKDEKKPLADGANHDDLIVWLSYKEAKALIGFEAIPPMSK